MNDARNYVAAAWAALGAWLLRRALLVFAAVLVLLVLLVALSGKKSQRAVETVQQVMAAGQLTKKQVRRKDAAIAELKDSTRHQIVIIQQARHRADSAVVQARVHEARADSILHAPFDEIALPAAGTAAGRAQSFLSTYQPRAVAQPARADSLR